MNTSEEQVRELIATQAGEWFEAHRDGPLDAAERRAFYAWLAASPAHIEEYLGVALISRHLSVAADDPDMPLGTILDRVREESGKVTAFERVAPSSLPGDQTRRMLLWGWAAVPAALAVIGGTLLWWSGLATKAEHYATRHGEQITQRLADGSVIRLDTDSAVTVRYDQTQRLVEVDGGRAFFEVSHDPGRPFRVLAGYAEARAVGTKFDVYRQSNSTVVTVVEGQVAVGLAPGQPGAAVAAGRTVTVGAGERLQVSQGSLPATSTPADTRRGTAWLRREIVFEQEPLAIVAAEFNRYSAIPIQIETPQLRSLEISGVFSADDPETFVAFLRSLDGVNVEVTRSRIRVSRN
jgi:transmembrane sensor